MRPHPPTVGNKFNFSIYFGISMPDPEFIFGSHHPELPDVSQNFQIAEESVFSTSLHNTNW